MYFEFALELSDIDLWNIDLLDVHLDLLDTNIPSKYFVSVHNVFMSSRRLQDMSSRRLQRNNFSSCKKSWRRLGRRKIVTLKRRWRLLQDMSWRRLEDAFKTIKCLLGTYFLQKWPMKEQIFRLSTARVKVHQISHVIFQTKSMFFSKVWIFFQCHER